MPCVNFSFYLKAGGKKLFGYCAGFCLLVLFQKCVISCIVLQQVWSNFVGILEALLSQ